MEGEVTSHLPLYYLLFQGLNSLIGHPERASGCWRIRGHDSNNISLPNRTRNGSKKKKQNRKTEATHANTLRCYAVHTVSQHTYWYCIYYWLRREAGCSIEVLAVCSPRVSTVSQARSDYRLNTRT
jgi:hypothetical protein